VKLCDMPFCYSTAEFHAVYGCYHGHVYHKQWCRPCLVSLCQKVGRQWHCVGNHLIMDMIYLPIQHREYKVNGKDQVIDYRGLVA
jgi:hypothetical protein